jgi:Protein of unknown function (DUF4435)
MIKQIDGAYIAANIRFIRQVHKGTVLLLEGETDARIFDDLIDSNKCQIEIGFGKRNVIDALDRLEDEGFPGVVAIVDADFDRLSGRAYELDGLCLTDKHDIDLTIFSSTAFDKYIFEYADGELCRNVFNSDITTIRTWILKAALPLAYCRFVSELRGLYLNFQDLRFDEFVNQEDLSIKTNGLATILIGRSLTKCTLANLNTYIAGEAAKSHDPYQLANGHDVAGILGIALRKLIGHRREVHTWASEVEAGLRLAFDWDKFKSTEICDFLRKWERRSEPYRVFREET